MTAGKSKGQVKPRRGLALSADRTRGLAIIGVLKAFNESIIQLSCLADACRAGVMGAGFAVHFILFNSSIVILLSCHFFYERF